VRRRGRDKTTGEKLPARHVVVDGSNIATEGSSLPSLVRLDQAVREFLAENPDDVVTVVVDATFGHRIPAEERAMFEEAELDGDIVSPPAGAIGRGDAFLLRVADKIGAIVLSNDSFQEFHGEYEWLFDKGRLIGGKPVPGVGWIFTPRSPVRGPKSREAVKEAKRRKRVDKGDEQPEGGLSAAERSRHKPGERRLQKAIATAVEEAVEPDRPGARRHRRRRGKETPSDPVNEPLAFINFIAEHQLGSEVEATVEEFSSHGAFVSVGDARCYVPLSAMGDPAPRSAREVLHKGEQYIFVVQAFDAMRRGVELAMPGFAHLAGTPTEETIEAEIERSHPIAHEAPAPRRRGRAGAKVGGTMPEPVGDSDLATGDAPAPARRRVPSTTTPGAAEPAQFERAVSKVAARRRQTAAVSDVGVDGPQGASKSKTVPTKAAAAKTAALRAKELLAVAPAAMSGPHGVGAKRTASSTGALVATMADAPAAAKSAASAKSAAAKSSPAKATGTKASGTKATGTANRGATKAPATKAPATKAPATKAATATKVAARTPGARTSSAKTAGVERAGANESSVEPPKSGKVSKTTKVAATKKAVATKDVATKDVATKKAAANKVAATAKATAITRSLAANQGNVTQRVTAGKVQGTKAAASSGVAKKAAAPATKRSGEKVAAAKRSLASDQRAAIKVVAPTTPVRRAPRPATPAARGDRKGK
jgi:hypothetical protein